MLEKFKYSLLSLLLVCSSSAFALSLDEAKSKGLLGETPSGYLEQVQPDAAAAQVMGEVNAKRRVEYQAIAQKNGTALNAVEALAGKKAIEKTGSGLYVKVDGRWVKK